MYLPEKADWLEEYTHELTTFPKGKHDDQVDSTSQALDWVRDHSFCFGVTEYYKQLAGVTAAGAQTNSLLLKSSMPYF